MSRTDQRVITADSVYRALSAGVNYTPPPVDFTTPTLLLGKVLLNTSGQRSAQQVTKTCTGRYCYAGQITRGVGQAYTQVLYQALIEKLPAHTPVDFQVQVLP